MITFISLFMPFMAMMVVLCTSSPFYISLSVIMVSFSFGLSLVFYGASWFFFSLVIMFLGGMMVVFVYASSLGSNFVMTFLVSNKFLVVVISMSVLMVILFSNNNMFIISQSLVSIYSLQSFIFIAILGSILLGVLFVVSKVVTMNDGAMKL